MRRSASRLLFSSCFSCSRIFARALEITRIPMIASARITATMISTVRTVVFLPPAMVIALSFYILKAVYKFNTNAFVSQLQYTIAQRRLLHYNKNMNTIVILAGGKSSRMGQDKIFLPYKESSFLGYLLQKAYAHFDRVIISAGSCDHAEKIRLHLHRCREDTRDPLPQILPDIYESLGPAGGLLSVFEQTALPSFAVTAADMPEADMEVLGFLLDLLHAREADLLPPAAVMLRIDPKHPEPCAAAYSRRSYALLKQSAEQGIRSPFRALGPSHILFAEAEELKKSSSAFAKLDFERSFRNINTADDYRSLNS